jgi:hypothetical protein
VNSSIAAAAASATWQIFGRLISLFILLGPPAPVP